MDVLLGMLTLICDRDKKQSLTKCSTKCSTICSKMCGLNENCMQLDVNGNIAYLINELNNCGSSTVAIDNKIEQAMDLVKSHLMFAVREEVEVLKEQIAELIERNNQLEHENGILRAAASPETLAKLAQPPPSSSS
ncbi:hypothetical protein DPMN_140126 [Dreissena polymorpha]|uniref:Uncharacterized protein n=2 Tax=Dreissena polymorpha TaxID=45954 RepID=A0A9D4G744_DREPO|nr:hypothetical protein DPMN_140126 [Dreissena polymorpha]